MFGTVKSYKQFLKNAVEVGEIVYGKDSIVINKLKDGTERDFKEPLHNFTYVEGIVKDAIYESKQTLKMMRHPKEVSRTRRLKQALHISKPKIVNEKEELQKQVPELTKLMFLDQVMCQTMGNIKHFNNINHRIWKPTPGEIIYYFDDHTSIFNTVSEARDKGAEFDIELAKRIASLGDPKAYSFVKEHFDTYQK